MIKKITELKKIIIPYADKTEMQDYLSVMLGMRIYEFDYHTFVANISKEDEVALLMKFPCMFEPYENESQIPISDS